MSMNFLIVFSTVLAILALLRLTDIAFPDPPLSWRYYALQLAIGAAAIITAGVAQPAPAPKVCNMTDIMNQRTNCATCRVSAPTGDDVQRVEPRGRVTGAVTTGPHGVTVTWAPRADGRCYNADAEKPGAVVEHY